MSEDKLGIEPNRIMSNQLIIASKLYFVSWLNIFDVNIFLA